MVDLIRIHSIHKIFFKKQWKCMCRKKALYNNEAALSRVLRVKQTIQQGQQILVCSRKRQDTAVK